MANTAINLTGQPSPSGNIPFLLYTPTDTSKKQPLIIFLHGAGEGSNGLPHDATTVRDIENAVGLMVLTKSSTLPAFTDPISGESFEFYMMAPQQYYPAGTSTATGSTWEHYYVTVLLDWAKENLNVDPTRIYLTGLSLGGGGTVDCMGDNAINTQIAAAVAICPGYGNGSDTVLTNIAKCGVQMWIGHAENDEATNPCRNSSGAIVACSTQGVQHNGELVGQQIVRRVNAKAPLVPIKYFYFTNGGHAIWYRFYDRTPGDVYPMMNGQDAVFDPGFFSWLLRYKRRSFTLPYYP